MYAGTGSYISASRPDPVQYSCQRNTVILSTDGFWNTDSCPGSFPCVGNTDSGGVRPYSDTVAASSNSMADIALYYWMTDLRTAGAKAKNNVPKTEKDTANWQHMVTFTLGLGANGVLKYVEGYETSGTSADYDAIIAGSKDWPNPIPTENAH
jgi:type IV pilus assembly protein PilY1